MRVLGIVAKQDVVIPTKLVDSKKYEILDESVFAQDDVSAIDKGSFLLAIEGVQKGLTPYNLSLSFSDAAKAYNVYPTMMSALGLASEYVGKAIYDIADKAETIQKVDATLAAMHAYVMDLFNTLPEDAYNVYLEKEDEPVAAVVEPVVTPEVVAEKAELEPVAKTEVVAEEPVELPIIKPAAEDLKPDLTSLVESLKADLLAMKDKIDANATEMLAMKESVTAAKREVDVMKGTVLTPAQGEKTKDIQGTPVVKRSQWSGTALDIFDNL